MFIFFYFLSFFFFFFKNNSYVGFEMNIIINEVKVKMSILKYLITKYT